MPAPSSEPFLEFRPPDTLYMHAGSGNSDIAEIARIFREHGQKSPFYLMVDFSGMSAGLDPKVRAEISKSIRPEWLLGCALINATMAMKLSVKTVNLALFLVGRADYPTEFVSNEADAIAAIERFRRQRASKRTG